MHKITLYFIIILISSLLLTNVLAKAPRNFHEAKHQARIIWHAHPETFYCGCNYDTHGNVDARSCHFKSTTRGPLKISWEHVVPVSRYGQALACWHQAECGGTGNKQKKGRACCRKMSVDFREMEADLGNLVPVIKEMNVKRKNYPFTEFSPASKVYRHQKTRCKTIIDERHGLIEPRDEAKGMVARIYFYMAKKYNIPLTDYEEKLFLKWDEKFPPDAWEQAWRQKVVEVQGI